MKKKLLLILIVIILAVSNTLVGCGQKPKDPNGVTDFLKDMDSYSTEFEMQIKNEKQTVTYTGKQFYKNGKGYRLNLGDDRVFTYKEDKIYVNDVKNGLKYTTDKDFDFLYRLSFIEEYIGLLLTNEEIKYTFKTVDKIEYLLIESIIPGGSKDISKAVLYVERNSCKPTELIIYGDDGKENIKVIYKNFEPFAELDDNLFKVN